VVVSGFIAIFWWLQQAAPDFAWVPWIVYPFIFVPGVRYMNKRELEFRGAAREDRSASE
jgi:hypothetical protein